MLVEEQKGSFDRQHSFSIVKKKQTNKKQIKFFGIHCVCKNKLGCLLWIHLHINTTEFWESTTPYRTGTSGCIMEAWDYFVKLKYVGDFFTPWNYQIKV